MTASSLAAFPMERRAHEIKLLVDLVRLSRVTLLYAEAGSNKSSVLQSGVMPLLEAPRGSGQTEVAVFFDAWDEEPLRALLARVREAVRAITPVPVPDEEPKGYSLAERLTALQEALGVTFLIVFDRFENYLKLPLERRSVREFEEEFVAVMNKPSLPANFLLALDQDAAPLLDRLRDRVPALGNASVRLPPASDAVPSALHTPEEHEPLAPHAAELSGSDASVAQPEQAELLEAYVAREQARYGKPAKPWALEETVKTHAQPSVVPRTVARRHADKRKRAWRRGLAWLTVAALFAALGYFVPPELWQSAERAVRARLSTKPASPVSPEPAKPSPKKRAAESDAVSVPRDKSQGKPEQTKPALEERLPHDKAPAQGHLPTKEPLALLPLKAVEAEATPQPQPKPQRDLEAPKPVASAPSSSVSPEAPSTAALYIYVRNEAQRARAQTLVQSLAARGIRVRGIELVTFGPNVPDLRYFRSEDQDEATQVARTLRNLGLPAQQLKRIPDFETRTALRQYELLLSPQLPEPPA